MPGTVDKAHLPAMSRNALNSVQPCGKEILRIPQR
jgi:hypothetical protein